MKKVLFSILIGILMLACQHCSNNSIDTEAMTLSYELGCIDHMRQGIRQGVIPVSGEAEHRKYCKELSAIFLKELMEVK